MLVPDQAVEKVSVPARKAGPPIADGEPTDHFLASLKHACERLIGQAVVEIRTPGGPDRRTVRMRLLDGRSVMATRRETAQRARLEERVLHHLGRAGAPVPRLLAFNGLMLVQEDLGRLRLSAALVGADAAQAGLLLERAADSLAAIHHAAATARIDRSVPLLGCDERWVDDLLQQPAQIGRYLGIKPSAPDLRQLFDMFLVTDPRFVKWDARPGNAIVKPDGGIAWFDWENCGARNRLDDLVWLLGDESVPELGSDEEKLVAKLLPKFADGRDVRTARRYFYCFGTFHMSVRLALILTRQEERGWQTTDKVIEQDEAGMSRELAGRLCQRAARWAGYSSATRALVPWFRDIQAKIMKLA